MPKAVFCLVRTVAVEGLEWSVRKRMGWTTSRGVGDHEFEIEYYRSPNLQDAKSRLDLFNLLLRPEAVDMGAAALGAIFRVERFAAAIANSSDQQGEANYATKAHMRSWGASISNELNKVVGALGDIREKIEAYPTSQNGTEVPEAPEEIPY